MRSADGAITFPSSRIICSQIRPISSFYSVRGVEVIHHPYYNSVTSFLRQHGQEFDLVLISRAEIAARYIASRSGGSRPRPRLCSIPWICVFSEKSVRLGSSKIDPFETPWPGKQEELRLIRRSDLTLVVSPIEKAILERECPEHRSPHPLDDLPD